MFRRVRWRWAGAYGLLVTAVSAITLFFINRPACLGSARCVQGTFVVGALVMGITAVSLSLILLSRFTGPIETLTAVTLRLLKGEQRARLMHYPHNEIGEFIQVYNQLVDKQSQTVSELAEERDQLASVLAYMADGVLIADDHGYVRQINPAAMRLLAATEKKSLGRPIAETLRHHQLIGLWQRCQREGSEQVAAVEVGRDLFLQAVVTPIIHQGSLVYLFILQDLTTIRRLETVRRDFISNLSHELRTPLASLRAVVETLQDGALSDPPAANRFLSRAEHEVDTLTQMVEELLELSRIESGRVPLRLSPTSVQQLLQTPYERFRGQARRDEVTITLEIADNLPTVLADADRVQQVINNLIHNALKFTPKKGSVTIQAYRAEAAPDQARKMVEGSPPCVIIAVSDTGSGISPEDLPRIFERFYKSDRARTRGSSGTGLGLAIARHIVQAHNGRLWAESKLGKGSVFYFNLLTS
jgi:two-component system, OmpR family, phosphate regulon sensor histidine kinase PhoR